MIKWTYTILIIVFFIPVVLFAFANFKKEIKKNAKFILYSGMLGFLIFFIVDPLATHWGAWSFDYEKTLGIKIGFSVLEELIWAILVSMSVSVAVLVSAGREEKKEPFFPMKRN